MAIPSTGPITLGAIQTEFGGALPISLSEYYAGGSYVPSGTSGTNGVVPTSGTISLWNFYGTSSASWTGTISTNQTNLNLATWASANGWNGTSAATITINSGVYVYSTSTGTPGLTTGSFPGGLTIINNGYIMGQGGNGGDVYDGQAGGVALSVSTNCTIQNNSYIAGGGGGGAHGYPSSGATGAGGGAGGGNGSRGLGTGEAGGGAGGGPGSAGNNGGDFWDSYWGSYTAWGGGGGGRILPGTGGAASTGGGAGGGGSVSGGGGSSAGTSATGSGGGGGWGASGGSSSGNSGGAGGSAVLQNSNTVTWTSTGTRYGAIVP